MLKMCKGLSKLGKIGKKLNNNLKMRTIKQKVNSYLWAHSNYQTPEASTKKMINHKISKNNRRMKNKNTRAYTKMKVPLT